MTTTAVLEEHSKMWALCDLQLAQSRQRLLLQAQSKQLQNEYPSQLN